MPKCDGGCVGKEGEIEMKLYRIEHKVSGLGPFQHGKQECLNSAIFSNASAFPDIDHIPHVKKFLRKNKLKCKFAFSEISLLNSVIKSKRLLEIYGFAVFEYTVENVPIDINGQCVFIEYDSKKQIPFNLESLNEVV